jgi:nitroreductase
MEKERFREAVVGPNLAAFRQVVQERRSVRVFDGTPLPEADVRECLRLALLAPNSSNLQPWEFYWVRSKEKKAELVKACLSQPAAATASDLIGCVARRDFWKVNRDRMMAHFEDLQKKGVSLPKGLIDYYQRLVPLAYSQGPWGLLSPLKRLVFWLRGLRVPTPREPASISDMRVWAVKSTSLAAQNLMLAFRAHGYDSCPMEGMDSTRVKRIIGAPAGSDVVMVVGAGVRKPEGIYGPQLRFDSRFFIHEV